MTTGKKVVILGGGVGGMSAAFELIERGFEVEVYERQLIPGGKARSIPVMEGMDDHGSKAKHIEAIQTFLSENGRNRLADQPRPWLPGEHGFRFFPNFYRHVTNTMSRIPYGKGTVLDNLVDTTRVLVATYDKAGIELPARFPQNLAGISNALKAFLYAISPRNEIAYADIEHFAGCIWRIITSCEERRFEEYERIGWWEFIGAESRSVAYQKFLAIGITRSLVAAKARTASTKTIGDIFVQLLFGILTPGVASDRLLSGPTNVVWIQPWLDDLRSKGVQYHFDSEVKSINVSGGRISSAIVECNGQQREVTGDWFISAMPVERIAPMITPAMTAIDPGLGNLPALATNVQWMNGIQFYLLRDVPIIHGHTIFIDSPWALTAVSQKQFWPDINLAEWGDGKTKGLISVDISQWDQPGFNGKCAIDCTREEIADEVWLQMKRSLNVDGETMLHDEDLHYWFLDPDIRRNPHHAGEMEDVEPLLVNRVNTWRLRPEAGTQIPNFMLASDYVRTYTDLATMEGANEAARRAVNAILERSDSDAEPCQIWNLHEPDALEPFRAYDKARYDAGMPWDDRFPKAVEAVLSLGQNAIGMTHGGGGPLTPFSGVSAEMSKPDAPPDRVALQALSLIGVPPGLSAGLGDHIPGLNTPIPGEEALTALAEAAGDHSAHDHGVPPASSRIRVTQKS